MDKKTVLEIIKRFHLELEARGIKPLKLILFGSYAEGNMMKGSDIDLIVISDDFIDKSYWERIDILSDAIYEIFAPIEAVAFTQDEWEQGDSFVIDFARDGETLFAA